MRALALIVQGLRIGDSIVRLRKLFPAARLHTDAGPDSGWWLIERRVCPEVGGDRFLGLLARVSGGKVAAFVVRLGVCE